MHPHFPNDHGTAMGGGPFHRHKSIHRLLGGGKGDAATLLFSFWTIDLHHLNCYQSFCLVSMWCSWFVVADILLWKDRNLSAGVLLGATLIWFLFEVVEYNVIPLLSQIAILAMLVIFIWSNAAPLLNMYAFVSLWRFIEIQMRHKGTRSKTQLTKFSLQTPSKNPRSHRL
jgi:hypothetical protein